MDKKDISNAPANNLSWANRTWCSCLQELRDFLACGGIVRKNRLGFVLSLVEELQTYGNRMEAHLEDLRDFKDMKKKYKKLKKKVEELEDKEEK